MKIYPMPRQVMAEALQTKKNL